MMRKIFILVPSINASGPVKGAVALANALCATREVALVSLKNGFDDAAALALDPRVQRHTLAARAGYRAKIRAYRALLREAGGRAQTASLSLCFSADVVNFFCRSLAVTCASVRGNLPANYRMDHGAKGLLAAFVHMAVVLRGFDGVVAMTDAMAAQLRRFCGRKPEVIGNFIDEAALEPYRLRGAVAEGPLRFVFLGSLSTRKQPLLLLQAAAFLHELGHEVQLDIVGKGPLGTLCETEAARLGLGGRVVFHGQIEAPYALLARADALVLPSLSEGLSRASLEALYLGTPCVLRAVDGNAALIRDEACGVLFARDAALPEAMLRAAQLSRARAGAQRGASLLPPAFGQAASAARYLDLMERA